MRERDWDWDSGIGIPGDAVLGRAAFVSPMSNMVREPVHVRERQIRALLKNRPLDQCSVRRINRVLSRTSSDYPPIILGRRIGIPLIARSGTHESIGGSYDDGLDRSSPPASGIYGADDCSVRRKPHSVRISLYHLLTLSFRVTKTCLQLTSSCRPLCEDKRNEKAFHKIFECS